MKKILTFILVLPCLFSQAQDHLGSFNSVQQMPTWTTCAGEDDTQMRTCTVDEIQMHLIRNMALSETELASIQGQLLMIRFVVDHKGVIKKPEVLGGKGGKAESSVLKAVDKLPPMNPGLHEGKPVDVLYVIPFRVNS